MERTKTADSASFVDTPRGIFTASGFWFLTREEDLRTYAGALLERVPLDRLIKLSEVWLRSAQTLALWITPLLLFYQSPYLVALIAITLYIGWETLGAIFVNRLFSPFLQFMDHVGVQALYYVITLSVLGMRGANIAVVTGLLLFVLLRWGLVKKLFAAVLEALRRKLYPLPYPDQILKSLMIRFALHHRIDLAEMDDMEKSILRHLRKK